MLEYPELDILFWQARRGSALVVNFPTRIDTILGVFGTSRTSLIERCVSLPGISDHDVVLVYLCSPNTQEPSEKEILSLETMEENLAKFTEKFMKHFSTSTPVNVFRNGFRERCSESIDTFDPSKQTSMRFSHAWCNRDIRLLSRRNKRAFRIVPTTKRPGSHAWCNRDIKKKQKGFQDSPTTKKQANWNRCKKLQEEIQQACRRLMMSSSITW